MHFNETVLNKDIHYVSTCMFIGECKN